jgi:hypothetical protein
VVADKRALAARKRKLSSAFDKFDKLFGEGPSDSHTPNDYGSHLDDLIIAQEEARRARRRRELEMESVLFYIDKKGHGFHDSICKYCELPFSHTYLAVAYCSERCRSAKLMELGIEYNIDGKTDHERWNCWGKGWMPKVIGPEAYEAIKMLESDYMEEENTPQSLPSLPEAEDGN